MTQQQFNFFFTNAYLEMHVLETEEGQCINKAQAHHANFTLGLQTKITVKLSQSQQHAISAGVHVLPTDQCILTTVSF